MPSIINATTTTGVAVTGDNSGALALQTNNGTTAVTIDTSQNVGIGTNAPTRTIDVLGTQSFRDVTGAKQLLIANDSTLVRLFSRNASDNSDIPMGFYTGATERMRITSGGALFIGKTTAGIANTGFEYDQPGGALLITRSGANSLAINRLTNDGNLVEFFQDSTIEGSISVSGTTVSYNGGHLSRWSQLTSGQKDDTLLKGTVMSNLDDMCVWTKDGETLPNEQLNKMKISDVEGDTNVAGVFVSWQFDEQCQSDDMNVAMTGDMIIRIANGVVVQKGDLLMSAGDGTAKPQGDDIRKSKTVAKVTSNHVTCTYADGSYCVPCVLMAC